MGRSHDEQETMTRLLACVSDLGRSARRHEMVDAILISLYHRGVPRSRPVSGNIAARVLCLLDVCPMSPKELGRLLHIDAETAVFKNALTSLRKLGMVKADGPKHERIYRLT